MKRKRIYPAKKSSKRLKRPNSLKSLLVLIVSLLLFGLIMIYDATVILSQSLYDNAYRFALLQLGWIIIGGIGFYIFFKLDILKVKKAAPVIFYLSVFFLIVLAFFGVLPCSMDFPFAPCVNGANRWFYLNPTPLPSIPLVGTVGFQPSEFAKFALVLFLASSLEKSIRLKNKPFYTYLLITCSISFLILLQPNMSTASLVFVMGSAMYFASGASLTLLFVTAPVALISGSIAILFSPYRRQRLLTQFSVDSGDLESGYHIKQILIALGSGGIFGMGFGQSRQKFQYLPEVFADSLFAIIGEELGFVGTTFLIALFSVLIYKGYSIAQQTNNLFSKLVAVGITSWIGLQFFINIGAMTKLIPLTGIPLPLISYGGSSLVFIMLGLGLLANIANQNDKIS